VPDHTESKCIGPDCGEWAMDGDGHCAAHAPVQPDPDPHAERPNATAARPDGAG